MAGTLDVGTLSGQIEFEDHVSSTLDLIMKKVDKLEDDWSGMGKQVASSAAGFLSAEVAIKAVGKAIDFVTGVFHDFTMEGAAIADVGENFDRLTARAGRLSSTLLNELRAGTHGTIDDFTLTKMAAQDLAAGMNLTDEQFRTVADGAFALAQATGTDVSQALDTMNDALLTGRTRSLQLLTGKIDLAAAEEKFAASLGTTVDKLSAEGKLQAARAAILESVGAATERLGQQTDGLDELLAQAVTTARNWYDELAKAVATSPNVIGAFEAIRDALVEAFGGDAQNMLQTAVGWVNNVADAITVYGPIVIDWFKTAAEWVVNVFNAVVDSWNALPDWLKNVATNSAIALVGIKALDVTVGAASSSITDLIGTAGNLTTTLSGLPAAFANVSGAISSGIGFLRTWWAVLDFSSLAQAGASFKLLGSSILGMIGPLGYVTIAVTAFFAAWEIGKLQPVSDFFQELGLRLMGYSEAEAEAMVATDHATQAMAKQAEQTKAQTAAQAEAKAITDQIKTAIEGATTATQGNSEALDQNKLVLAQTAEEAKKFNEAMEQLNSVGTSWKDTINQIDGEIVEAIQYYLDAGVAQNQLAVAYGLTATQVKAVAEAHEAEKKSIQETKEIWNEYFNLRIEHGGTATDKQIADIDRWFKDEAEKLNKSQDNWAAHYDALTALRDEKMQGVLINWDDVRTNSKSALEEIAAKAKATFDYVSANSQEFTREFIDLKKAEMQAANDAVREWGHSYQTETDKAINKEKELQKAIKDTAAAKNESFSFDVTKGNLAEVARSFGIDVAAVEKYAKEGFSFTEILQALKGGYEPKNPKGPRIAGFREGGVGDFKDGTLAMLHGKEAVIPLDRGLRGLGSVTNHIYINDTLDRAARKVADEIMRTAKFGRQFGRA